MNQFYVSKHPPLTSRPSDAELMVEIGRLVEELAELTASVAQRFSRTCDDVLQTPSSFADAEAAAANHKR